MLKWGLSRIKRKDGSGLHVTGKQCPSHKVAAAPSYLSEAFSECDTESARDKNERAATRSGRTPPYPGVDKKYN